ncbi:MAG: NAD-dependent epimerase/dehydratase family protein [Limisphaerales bacterium]|jgi:nucleoside-diphosphate-sugar epimerase|nr:epimerase [Pedosphaera sp.]HBF02721.1 epimerase [Verrucomicrobiales bacterium]HCB97128.1 epimerase [Verrucomicrobiales bacterium]HCQ84526.1 epimerase [Verrucomicrobiales bacterium]
MERILITGGAGFIGSWLAEALLKTGRYHLTLLDNLSTGKRAHLPAPNTSSWSWIEGDANHRPTMEACMGDGGFDFVFHYAAVVGVQRTQEHPMKVLEDIDGLKNILDLSHQHRVKRVFLASSSEVYGEPVELPQHEETTPLNSRLPYAVVKNLGEVMLRAYHKEYGLPYTIFRFFNTYGPRQSEDFVITRFVQQALRHAPITLYGDGEQTRTFCHISDNIEATTAAMMQGHFINDVVNIGNPNQISIRALAEHIIAETQSRSPIIHLPALEDGDMQRRQPDTRKMEQLLPRALKSLQEGLKDTIAYLR